MDDYYISFVVATRNDDHGGNMDMKNQFFIDKWAYVTSKFNLSCELIIIDWNPLNEKEDLKNTIKYPQINPNQSIRVIKVPEKFHREYKTSKQLNFYQMQAKNVGIRRAKGKFILCTNIDIIFSEEMIKYLSKKELDENKVYRTDRYDIDFDLFDNLNNETEFFMNYCSGIHKKNYSIDLKSNKKYYIYRSVGRTAYEEVFLNLYNIFSDYINSLVNKKKKDRYYPILRPILFIKKFITRISRLLNSLYLQIINLIEVKSLPELHTNGCGDFTLASQKVWGDCNGYYEYDGYSFFIDSLFLYCAYYKGYNTNEINKKIFHINHSQGFVAGSDDLFKSLRKRNIPYIDFKLYLKYLKLYKKKKNYLSKKVNWGLNDKMLDEFKI